MNNLGPSIEPCGTPHHLINQNLHLLIVCTVDDLLNKTLFH